MIMTTTGYNACDVSLWLDNPAGVLTDISGSSNTINVSFTKDMARKDAFGSVWGHRYECLKDCKVQLNIICSETNSEAWDLLVDWWFAQPSGKRTLTWYQPDKNVGSDKFSGEFRIQDLGENMEAGKAEPIGPVATLLCDGEVTHVTNAT
jgi:hypothetical protein